MGQERAVVVWTSRNAFAYELLLILSAYQTAITANFNKSEQTHCPVSFRFHLFMEIRDGKYSGCGRGGSERERTGFYRSFIRNGVLFSSIAIAFSLV